MRSERLDRIYTKLVALQSSDDPPHPLQPWVDEWSLDGALVEPFTYLRQQLASLGLANLLTAEELRSVADDMQPWHEAAVARERVESMYNLPSSAAVVTDRAEWARLNDSGSYPTAWLREQYYAGKRIDDVASLWADGPATAASPVDAAQSVREPQPPQPPVVMAPIEAAPQQSVIEVRIATQSELMNAALGYAAKGWPVFPAHYCLRDGTCSCGENRCGSHSKHPRTKRGLLDATTDVEQITRWWTQWPEANVGVRTGRLPNGRYLGVVDRDIKPEKGIDGPARWSEIIAAIGPITTFSQKTGGDGDHDYFETDEAMKNSVSKIAPGIDVRGVGGYVIAAPSNHASGRLYAVVNDAPLATLPKVLVEAAAASGPDEARAILERAGVKFPTKEQAKGAPKSKKTKQPTKYDSPYPHGTRDDSLYRYGCSLRATGCETESEMVQALRERNATHCQPPLRDTQVLKCARSAMKHAPGTSARQAASVAAKVIDASTREVAEQWPDEPELAMYSGPPKFSIGDSAEVAAKLLKDARADSPVPLVFDRGRFWRYSGGVWKTIGRERLGRLVQRYSGAPVGDKKFLRVNDTDPVIKAAAEQCAKPGFFDRARSGVVFRNGFVTLDESHDVVLLPHSPDHRATLQLDHHFDPDCDPTTEAPLFISFANAVFAPADGMYVSADERNKPLMFLMEFTGAALLGIATRFGKALFMVGDEAENGKSTAIKIVKACFPADAVTAVPPTRFDNEFYLAQLATSRLNAVAELRASASIWAGDDFKKLITGDEVSAAHKHRDPFKFIPKAGHVFACNTLPDVGDDDAGFWRRIITLRFDRTFKGAAADKTIAERIIKYEIGAVASMAIHAASRLCKQGEYTEPRASVLTKAEWKRDSNPLTGWYEARTAVCSGECRGACGGGTRYAEYCCTTQAEAYESYVDWASTKKQLAVSAKKFGLAISTLGVKRVRVGEKRGYWFFLRDKPYQKDMRRTPSAEVDMPS